MKQHCTLAILLVALSIPFFVMTTAATIAITHGANLFVVCVLWMIIVGLYAEGLVPLWLRWRV